MSKTAIFFTTGFEEVEALTVVDILRRCEVEVNMVSITGDKKVVGAHNIVIDTDSCFENEDFTDRDMLILPGGPGTKNLEKYEPLMKIIKEQNEKGKYIAAICAAPTVFGHIGLLEGKNACCYPGMEDGLIGAKVSYEKVEVAGNIITSRGVGTAIPFALKLAEILVGKDTADKMAQKIVFQ